MGDRALIQLKYKDDINGKVEYSPVLYLHWHGSSVGEILQATNRRMLARGYPDLPYTFARLVQIATAGDNEHTGFGVWNSETEHTDSHGDAGVFIVDIDDPNMWKIKQFGGYGLYGYDDEGDAAKPDPTKFPNLTIIS